MSNFEHAKNKQADKTKQNRKLNKEVESFSKEIGDMMKNKMEIFELKNTVTEAQEQKERIEERINELEDRTVEITKYEQQKESEMEPKNEQSYIWDLTFMLPEFLIEGRRLKKYLKK